MLMTAEKEKSILDKLESIEDGIKQINAAVPHTEIAETFKHMKELMAMVQEFGGYVGHEVNPERTDKEFNIWYDVSILQAKFLNVVQQFNNLPKTCDKPIQSTRRWIEENNEDKGE